MEGSRDEEGVSVTTRPTRTLWVHTGKSRNVSYRGGDPVEVKVGEGMGSTYRPMKEGKETSL